MAEVINKTNQGGKHKSQGPNDATKKDETNPTSNMDIFITADSAKLIFNNNFGYREN